MPRRRVEGGKSCNFSVPKVIDNEWQSTPPLRRSPWRSTLLWCVARKDSIPLSRVWTAGLPHGEILPPSLLSRKTLKIPKSTKIWQCPHEDQQNNPHTPNFRANKLYVRYARIFFAEHQNVTLLHETVIFSRGVDNYFCVRQA